MNKSFLRVLLSLALCFVSLPLSAQKIDEIEVRGNQRLPDQAVIQYLGSKPGQEMSRIQIRDDLKTLYNTGNFKDIRIDLEESPSGLVKLVIVVEEKDFIQEVTFEGNKKVDKDDIEKALALKPPFLWDEAQVAASVDKLRKLYRDKGYNLVTIRPEVVSEGRRKILKFDIDEGSRVLIRKIYIQGNTVLEDRRLKEAMIAREGGFWSNMGRRSVFDEDLLVQVDSRRLQMEYLRRGYAYAEVDPPSVTFTPDRKSVVVSYFITEGDQYDVGEITFSGDLDFIDEPEKVVKSLSSKRSKVWNIDKIQQDIQSLQDIYGNQGYAYANVSPVWTKNPENPELLDIDFRIDKGSIVYFGNVEIHGNLETLDRIIRRELEFVEGELFDVTKYRDSKANLDRLGYFSAVNFIQKDILAQNRMDITIEVEERQTGTLTLGASFSSFDRFGLQGAVSKVNLFGRGYDVSLSGLVSSRRQIFSLYFRDPRVLDSKFSLTVQAFNTEVQSIDETRIRERGGSVGLGYPLNKEWRVNGTYGIKDISINIRESIERYFPDSFGLDSNLAFSISRDTLNTREVFLPSAGSLHSLTATTATTVLGSDLAYMKVSYSGKKYIQLFEPKVAIVGGSVLSFGLRADYLRGIQDKSTPYNERFVPGGIYSIRGHLFRSLGPSTFTPFNITGRRADDGELAVSDADKLRLGGNKQWIFNVEYLFDIFKEAKIKGVLFVDVGNTFVEGDYNLWETRESAGFGFRWFSPLGPLRFEWGIPLDRKEDENRILFDFSIGAPF